MHLAEIVGRPGQYSCAKGERRQIRRPPATPSCIPSRVQQDHVDDPHQSREQNLRIGKISAAKARFSQDRSGDESQRHEWEAPDQAFEANFINRGQRRQS